MLEWLKSSKLSIVTFLISYIFFYPTFINGQTNHVCLAEQHFLKSSFADDYQQAISKILADQPEKSFDNLGLIKIPIVVHVLYNTPNQNISDAQIDSQVEVLNLAFDMEAPWITSFWPQTADVDIEFELATTDPLGNPSTGITRTATNVDIFEIDLEAPLDDPQNAKMKLSSDGGKDAWPSDQYLNIWVVNMQYVLKGFGTFPGSIADHLDGIVMNYKYFGSTGTGTTYPNYALGKSCVHEVGHWLNLRHPWGSGDCSINDGIPDTPNQETYHFSCAEETIECNNTIMLSNYLQYTYDQCQFVFTEDQKTVMRANFAPGGLRSGFCDENNGGGSGATVMGRVWRDYNNDNAYDQNEMLQSGVTVQLYDCFSDQMVGSQQSDSQGNFSFDNVENGAYFIQTSANSLPNQYGPHPIYLNKFACFDINTSGEYQNQIPLLQHALVEGRIWEDIDGDGMKENFEPDIPNIQIDVKNSSGITIHTVYSDNNGNYEIDKIYPDSYYLDININNIYNHTDPHNTNSDFSDSDIGNFMGPNTTQLMQLDQGEELQNIDGGFYRMVNIGEQVWHDLNANGIQDNDEPGLSGISIQIYDSSNGTPYMMDQTNSNFSGNFNFEVPPGEYFLQLNNLSGNYNISPMHGGNENIDNDIDPLTERSEEMFVFSGEFINNLGIGLFQASGISGSIWYDTNLNGTFDTGENPAVDVMVQLFNQQSEIIDVDVTNLNGTYTFEGLDPHDYYLAIILPDGTQINPQPTNPHYFDGSNGPSSSPYYSFSSGEMIDGPDAGLTFGTVALEDYDFFGEIHKTHNLLRWNVSSSVDYQQYCIEKSNNGNEWFDIHCNPNYTGSFEDIDITSGEQWYRLRANYFETIDYSKTIILQNNGSDQSISFSNPVNQVLHLFPNKNIEDYSINIYDCKSAKVGSFEMNASESNNNLNLSHLSAGIYFIEFNVKHKSFIDKLVIIH